MKVIIPLAGFGTRLRPHTYTRPKPLINVAGKSVLGHVLDIFQTLPVEDYIFITGYLGEQVQQHVHQHYPMLKTHYRVQEELNGQSSAVLLAKEFIGNSPVLIVFVDTIVEVDLTQLQHETADAVVFVKKVTDPRRFGVVELGEDGYVRKLIEKPSTFENDLAVVGFYYIKDGNALMEALARQISLGIKTKGEYFLADALQLMIQDGLKMRAQEVGTWLDCGQPDTVLETNRYLLENGLSNTTDVQTSNNIIIPPVYVHPSAQLCQSVIGPHVSIGENCRIENSIIRNSIIDKGAEVQDAMLSQSLIGRQARVSDKFRTYNVGDQSVVGRE
jgi:glucose-1-phosphate thymidylyltransferase